MKNEERDELSGDLWECSVCGKRADTFFVWDKKWCPDCVLKHGGEFERDEDGNPAFLTKKPNKEES